MRTILRCLSVCLGLLLALGIPSVTGQTSPGTTVSFTVQKVQSLNVRTARVRFGLLEAADYERGFRELSPAQTLLVRSNIPWVVYIRADRPTWTYTPQAGAATPDPRKPASDLQWRSASSHPRVTATHPAYTSVTTADAPVAAGQPGKDLPIQVDFRVRVDYESTPPGEYTLSITYTISAP